MPINIRTLQDNAAATTKALEAIRAHTQKAIDRAYANLFFVEIHGFFEANPAVDRIEVDVEASGEIDDEGFAFSSYSLGSLDVAVYPDIAQSEVYGFNDIGYNANGVIILEDGNLDKPLSNDALAEAIKNRLQDMAGNYDWFSDHLPHAVGNPDGRSVELTVNRTQADYAIEILLAQQKDCSGNFIASTPQQIQSVQDDILNWVDYK